MTYKIYEKITKITNHKKIKKKTQKKTQKTTEKIRKLQKK